MDELQTKLLEYLNGAEKLIVENGPKAYDATVGLVHLNAWLTLGTGVILLFLCIAWMFGAHKLAKRVSQDSYDADEAITFVYGIAGVLCLFPLLAAAAHLLSKSAWIGVINPELGLLWEIYQKFIG